MSDSNLSERLSSLLEAERQALIAGDLERVSGLLEEKQALVEDLSASPETIENLEPLRSRLRRNQELFDQSLAGLRNVVSRLGTLQDLRKSLDTYDENGRRMTIVSTAKGRLERRA